MNAPMRLMVVGLGPGDPELVTLKGLRAIEAADVIFVPRSQAGDESLAFRIARHWIDPARQQVIELPLPMTRDSAQLLPAWQAAADGMAARLAACARAIGREARGAYLLLGDPLLYGTFTYIARELAVRHREIAIEIIPGVTSFAATAARAQLPLGTTDDRVAIVPASYETDGTTLRQLLADFETVILMKVGSALPQVLATLEELELLDAALYAERVGMPEEYIVRDVRSLRGQRRPYLSLLIVRRGGEGARSESGSR